MDSVFVWALWIVVIGVLAVVIILALDAVSGSSNNATQKRELKEKYSAILQPLVLFAGKHGTGLREVAKRASEEADKEELSAAQLLMCDLIVLIKTIAKSNEDIRLSDAEMLQVYCWDCNAYQFSSNSSYDFLRMMKDFSEEKLITLQGMQMLNAPGTQELADVYLKLVKKIATTQGRKAALKAVTTKIKTTADPGSAPISEEMLQSTADKLEEILDGFEDEIDRAIKEDKDPRFGIVGIVPTCRSIEELDKVYFLRVQLYNADNYAFFSPKLRRRCERLNAVTKKAYESLRKEFILESRSGMENTEAHALLGVEITCSAEELKSAYHAKVAAWHPDKLAHMAPELQDVATQKVVKLNEAYETIMRERETRKNREQAC